LWFSALIREENVGSNIVMSIIVSKLDTMMLAVFPCAPLAFDAMSTRRKQDSQPAISERLAHTFGAVLRWHRRNLDLTQEELAMRSSLERTYLSRLERGLQVPTIATLWALAEQLDMPAWQLLKDVEEKVRAGK
jgi:ribosome-binding protein aMBF1 (putative translation factor)